MGLVAAVVGSIILVQQVSVQGQEGAGHQEYIVRKPPASLDKYYPPEAEGPLYLFAMYTMDAPLVGLMTHLHAGDMAKAQEYFKAFAVEYKKLAAMVPEWSHHYWPEEPVEAISAALESGDPGKVGAAMPGLIQACVRCHSDNISAVWARYQKDMHEIGEFMFELLGPFAAVNTYVAEGEFDKARGAMGAFQERMGELAESCGSCHETERTYYVGSDVQELLKSAAEALKEETPNAEQIMGTMQRIGMESCYKCHKVHMPIANIQKAWGGEAAHTH